MEQPHRPAVSTPKREPLDKHPENLLNPKRSRLSSLVIARKTQLFEMLYGDWRHLCPSLKNSLIWSRAESCEKYSHVESAGCGNNGKTKKLIPRSEKHNEDSKERRDGRFL